MNAKELFTIDGKSSGVFFCGECMYVYRTKEDADSCCLCNRCKTEKKQSYYCYCESCKVEIDAEKKEKDKIKLDEILNNAEEVIYPYAGPVFYNREYYHDIETLIEYLEDKGIEFPEFAFAGKPVKFSGIDFDDILDRINEDCDYDDYFNVRDILKGMVKLSDAIKQFNERNKETVLYYVIDHKLKVRV